MKLVFEGDSIHDIHQQIIDTAVELKNLEVGAVNLAGTQHTGAVVGFDPAVPGADQAVVINPPMMGPAIPVQSPTLGEVDSAGIKYDSRIHSSGKEKTASGNWRKRRHLEPGLYERLIAEQKGQVVSQQAPVDIQVPQMPTSMTHVATPVAPALPASIEQALSIVPQNLPPVNIAPPAPVAPPPVAVDPLTQAYTVESFGQNLAVIISKLLDLKKINQEWIQECKTKSFGGKEIYEWSANTEAVASLFRVFVHYGFVQKLSL